MAADPTPTDRAEAEQAQRERDAAVCDALATARHDSDSIIGWNRGLRFAATAIRRGEGGSDRG